MTAGLRARLWVIVAALSAPAAMAGTVTYEMVTVGDAGNANDSTGYGAVAYDYRIGKYDVTIGQYATFLNAVAKTDTYGLFSTGMESNLNVAGISRAGSSGNYSYSVMDNGGSSENRPITYVSWFDVARFANWMANGQPTGGQNAATTENGVYNLNGATSGSAPVRNATNPNTSAASAFWIPTENEWYKAAYYQPASKGGPGDGYWSQATRSDSIPGNVIGAAANQANYLTASGFSVTQSSTLVTTQNYLTDVGAFTGSASYYGTFDQGGLVAQWNDLAGASDIYRGVRGGDWDSSHWYNISANQRAAYDTYWASWNLGFRLAGPSSTPVPEIDPAGAGSVLALVSGALGLLERRRGMRA